MITTNYTSTTSARPAALGFHLLRVAELVELRAKPSAAFGVEGACELVQPDTVLWMYFACHAMRACVPCVHACMHA